MKCVVHAPGAVSNDLRPARATLGGNENRHVLQGLHSNIGVLPSRDYSRGLASVGLDAKDVPRGRVFLELCGHCDECQRSTVL